jgi:prophage DNA circulation protein
MDWTIGLRPASFAGVGFYWRSVNAQGGQRLIVHELPQAPADLENIGTLPRRFALVCYFIGDAWLLEREAFIAVLQTTSGAATLVLPTKGPLRVRVATYRYEDNADIGNYGAVSVDFVIDDGIPAPFTAPDSASAILNSISAMQAQIIATYLQLAGPLVEISAAASYAQTLLGSAASAFTALPLAIVGGINAAFGATPTDASATATTITAAFLAASTNAQAVIDPPSLAATPLTGTLPTLPLPPDPSYGLAALASFGANPSPAPASPLSLAALQSAIDLLVDQSAALALVNLYAQTDFANANDAANARAQLATVLDAIGAATYDAGQVDLYRAWSALGAQSIADMVARAQNLPSIAIYSERRSLPDVVLAQRLYQDGTQADALAALNAAVHPLFMPLAGQWLQAA